MTFSIMVNGSYLKRKEDKLPLRVCLFVLALTFALLNAGTQAAIVLAQTGSGITAPASGETISGVVEVRGTAVHPDYLRFELAFANQTSGTDWIVFAEGSEPVVDGVLAVWDTTVGQAVGAPVFPDGRYQLRLRVVKTDFNYDEYFVTDLIIQNEGATPTPTPDETDVGLTATAVAPAQPTGSDESSFQQPTPLPSLTPFPSPTPPPTVVGGTPAAPQAVGASDEGGLLGQLETAETDRVGSAFWLGIRLTIGLFLIAGGYLLLRWVGRRLWHIYWTNKSSGK
ncbi:MAG: hypothetical protein H6657_21755 [Ardenticatenaceae bacterium]|nr:hypothetical protein [Ardenticatenaceae bacterium]